MIFDVLQAMDVIIQLAIKEMTAECFCIAKNDKFHFCPCDGDIHATQIAQETYLSIII